MKNRFVNYFKENTNQFIQFLIFLIIIIFGIYLFFNTSSPKNVLRNLSVHSDETELIKWLMKFFESIHIGKYYFGILINTIIIDYIYSAVILKILNKDTVVYKSNNIYHDYPYAWYWIMAKILQIKKCNLVRIPNYLQFKLVINGTFDEYPLDNNDYTPDNNNDIKVKMIHDSMPIKNGSEINLLLEDTYVIKSEQLPEDKKDLFTVKISRNDKTSIRKYCRSYIDKVTDYIRKLQGVDLTINVYSTLNPKNVKEIAKSAFATKDRSNVKHLYVYQPDGKKFEFKRKYKVY